MSYDPTQHLIAHGTKLEYSDVSGTPAYTEVFGVTDVDFPSVELSTAEITNNSTASFSKDYIPGMLEPGKVSFKVKYTKSQFAALDTIFQLARAAGTRASATKLWKITLTDGSTCVGQGFLTKHSYGGGADDDVPEVDAEIQCRGAWVFTAGT